MPAMPVKSTWVYGPLGDHPDEEALQDGAELAAPHRRCADEPDEVVEVLDDREPEADQRAVDEAVEDVVDLGACDQPDHDDAEELERLLDRGADQRGTPLRGELRAEASSGGSRARRCWWAQPARSTRRRPR